MIAEPTTPHRQTLTAVRVTVWGGVLVIGGILLAMALYGGWFGGEPAARKFSIFCDYLSMLGRTRNYDNHSNLAASLVFNAALVGTGILYAVFWPGRGRFIPDSRTRRTVTLCGWVMAAGLASLGLAPENLYPHLHPLLTVPPVMFGTAATLLCMFKTAPGFDNPRVVRWTMAAFGLAFVIASVLRLLVAVNRIDHRPALPIMQKVLIIMIVAWTFRQAWLMRQALLAGAGQDAPHGRARTSTN